ncbi:MAG: hypothetical protein WAN00_01290 [Trebonia sp.]
MRAREMIVQMEHPIMGPAPLLLDRDGPAAVVSAFLERRSPRFG